MIAVAIKFYDADGVLMDIRPCIFDRWINIQEVTIAPPRKPETVLVEVDGVDMFFAPLQLSDFSPGAVVNIPVGGITAKPVNPTSPDTA
jgi:hypothetical protein